MPWEGRECCDLSGTSPVQSCRQILPVRSLEQKVGIDVDLNPEQHFSTDTANANGHRRLGATLGTLASFVVLLLASSSASAATLNVSGGQLLGASGVDVGGAFYNVEFLDGTCIALYNGCDSLSDFTFQTIADATLASQALLDQVFVDGTSLFDTDPALTFGCIHDNRCQVLTPYILQTGFLDAIDARAVIAFNHASEGNDGATLVIAIDRTFDVSGPVGADRVWASWTPVPEPGTALLLSLGLLGLSARKRREG
jgi:hypothetical protein